MPDLRFTVEGASAVRSSLAPAVSLALRVENAVAGETIAAGLLRCRVVIEPARRRYTDGEAAKLEDLFGDRSRWGETLRPLQWTQVSVLLRSSGEAEVVIPCPHDPEQGPARYVFALEGGEVPIALQLTGTIFYREGTGAIQVAQLPWDKETHHRLAVSLLAELTVPSRAGETTISLRPDVFLRLEQWKQRHGFADWERALESLLRTREAA